MEFPRGLPRSIESNLEELLLHFYDAPTLKRLYLENCVPQKKRAAKPKPPRKALIAEAILKIAADPEQTWLFFERFAPPLAEALSILLWVPKMSVSELEDRLGRKVADPFNGSRRAYYQCQLNLRPEYYLLVLWENDRGFYGLYREERVNKSDYYLCLPKAIRTWLAPYAPKPEGYDLKGSRELQSKAATYSCAEHSLQDLVTIADFVDRGGAVRTKGGKLTRGALKNITSATAGGEPFAGSQLEKVLPDFRHRFLVDFLEGLPRKLLKKMADASFNPKPFLRQLPDALSEDAEAVADTILPHLRVRRGHYAGSLNADSKGLTQAMQVFFDMPPNKWHTCEALLDYCRFRQIDGVFFNLHYFEVEMSVVADAHARYGGYCDRREISAELIDGVITAPVLAGLSVLLSALGLLEIAYTKPENPNYRVRDKAYLSPFDGIQGVRLTPLGAYAFGLCKEVELPELNSNAVELHFHPERLHLKATNLDPITEKTLGTYMSPIGGGLYCISRESFLKGCDSVAAVAAHVQQFKQSIPAKLPGNWQAFFRALEEEPAVLKEEPFWRLYQLPEDTVIRRAFVEDALLRQHCKKVEGGRIAIESKHLGAVEKRLRKLGFFPH
ncbi:MAG: hypothetical protein ACLFU4_07390 [Opitutales bacterium]